MSFEWRIAHVKNGKVQIFFYLMILRNFMFRCGPTTEQHTDVVPEPHLFACVSRLQVWIDGWLVDRQP